MSTTVGTVEYRLADIFQAEFSRLDGGNYDLVTAVFALHYAPNTEALVHCLKEVHAALKVGGSFVSLVGHMDKFTALPTPDELNQKYALVGFKVTFSSWPPVAWTPTQYDIFEGDPASTTQLYHLDCNFLPISVYSDACKLAGFDSIDFRPWQYPGLAHGQRNEFFDRVIDVEPHTILVARKI